MTGFRDLPEELVSYIIEYACHLSPCSAVHQLLFVNRQFSRLVLPSLYRNVSHDECGKQKPSSFSKLVLSLIFDPAKAALVRSLDLGRAAKADHWIDNETPGSGNGFQPLPSERSADVKRLVDEIYDTQFEKKNPGGGRYRLEEPSTSEQLVLMMSRLPNLHSLTTQAMGNDVWEMIGFITDGLAPVAEEARPRPFSKLETAVIGDDFELQPAVLLFLVTRWSSIKHLRFRHLGAILDSQSIQAYRRFLDLVPQSTNFTTVSFRPSSLLRPKDLSTFLGTAKALERFDHHCGPGWLWDHQEARDMMHALDQHKRTLRDITLQHSELEPDDLCLWTAMRFGEYPLLERLNIACHFLFGSEEVLKICLSEMFPKSLKVLKLVQCDPELIQSAKRVLVEILRHKQGNWDALQELTLALDKEAWQMQDMTDWMEMAIIGAEATSKGVNFGLTMCQEDSENGLELRPPASRTKDDGDGENDSGVGGWEDYTDDDEWENESNDDEWEDDNEDDEADHNVVFGMDPFEDFEGPYSSTEGEEDSENDEDDEPDEPNEPGEPDEPAAQSVNQET